MRGAPGTQAAEAEPSSLPPEVDEDSTEVPRILLDPVVPDLHLRLVQEAQDPFLQLARTFAGDDLHEARFRASCLVHDVRQSPVDVLALVVDLVEIELQLQSALAFTSLSTMLE